MKLYAVRDRNTKKLVVTPSHRKFYERVFTPRHIVFSTDSKYELVTYELIEVPNNVMKETPYICKVENNKFGYHQCKCGVFFVDAHFDGYCGCCGRRIYW